MRATTRLRQLLAGEELIVAPFVFDALQAKLVERTGFPATYMTGFGTAAARGHPDVGLVTMTEMAANARAIASAVSIPVICDADTGYGNPLNVIRTIREYEAAGVAALHLEDQVFPKKCGFMRGKQLVPMEEHVQKLRAALDARTDPDFVIIARTDALAVHGWEEVLRRCRAYHEAGADLVFVDGIRTPEDLAIYARELPGIPKLLNGQLVPTGEVQRLGFKVNICAATLVALYRALHAALVELKETGAGLSMEQDLLARPGASTFDAITDLLGLPDVYETEAKYGVTSEAAV
jgi:2-methylisocitrate lyase-like PEP mutase family enzyme